LIRNLLFTFALISCLATPQVHAAAAASPAHKSVFAAHKALYDIRLSSTKSGSQIVNITGKMLYEWQPTCEAWIANHRFNLFYEYADSPAMKISSDFSTYETFDGKSIDFTSQRKRDGQLIEELRGSAELDDQGKGSAVYTLPRGLEFDLPAGSMLPMAHTRNIIKAIADQQKIYHATVFDGSDAEGPVEINAIIGKNIRETEIVKASKDVNAGLLKSPAHKVRLAFFPLNNASESSDYEMDIVLHDNGIISDMFIEYDDFSITQKLVALEPLADSCQQ
jgi:hypothetical protein